MIAPQRMGEPSEQNLRTENEKSLEEQYIRGYLEQPETAEESEWLGEAAAEVFAKNPWGQEGQD